MSEWRRYHDSIWAQGKLILAGTASIIINLIQAVFLRLPTKWPLNTILFWILLAITLGSLYWAIYLAWRGQYRRAEAFKREADEIYADVVLGFLLSRHVKYFPLDDLAKLMQYDAQKVLRGLRVLEKEFKVVRDEGAIGWYFDAERAIFRGLDCTLRRILLVQNSN